MIDIDQLTIEELIILNHRVVERLKFLQKARAHVDMMAFNLGAKVSFETDQGRCFGRLAKYNQKTVTVITDGGQQWRIPPHLLSAVKDITPKDNSHNSRHRNKKKRLRKK